MHAQQQKRPFTLVALTEAGLKQAKHLQAALQTHCDTIELLYKPQPFAEQVQARFAAGHALIMVTATGIAVRTLAPVLVSKQQDPPVLVLDEQGLFVVPLLSGHEGGANELGRIVADTLQAQLVITTAKPYLKPVYTVGMGCERGCPEAALRSLLDTCLAEAGLTLGAISSINSIALKADELGLIHLAHTVNLPFNTWSVTQLTTMDDYVHSRSDYVFNTVGVYGVAEPAALYAAQQLTGNCPELYLTKHKTKKATCAIARSFPSYPQT